MTIKKINDILSDLKVNPETAKILSGYHDRLSLRFYWIGLYTDLVDVGSKYGVIFDYNNGYVTLEL